MDASDEERLHLPKSDGNSKRSQKINTEGFDWLESTELAIDKRTFLPSRLFKKQPLPQDED